MTDLDAHKKLASIYNASFKEIEKLYAYGSYHEKNLGKETYDLIRSLNQWTKNNDRWEWFPLYGKEILAVQNQHASPWTGASGKLRKDFEVAINLAKALYQRDDKDIRGYTRKI